MYDRCHTQAAVGRRIGWLQRGPNRGEGKKKRTRSTVIATEINKPVLDRNSPRFCPTTSHSPLASHHSYLSPLPRVTAYWQLPPLYAPRSPTVPPRRNPIRVRVYSHETPIVSLAPADPSPILGVRDVIYVRERDREGSSFPELALRLVARLLGRRRSGRHQRKRH